MKAEKILRVLLQEFIEKYSNSHISLGELKRIRGTLWKLWKLDPAKAHFQGMLCEAVDGNPCISLWDNTPLSGKRNIRPNPLLRIFVVSGKNGERLDFDFYHGGLSLASASAHVAIEFLFRALELSFFLDTLRNIRQFGQIKPSS
ncbi:MAG: hypothetical protein A3C07_02245 [Candidatus Sungbacteria bacterium RIFCSPHIGHO2_02_FULL_47_11]|uniref:Uncharacterized protein n=1 Tax=Candidatus Sungbacteria bacterium RIFCSPHIGHO2_02_FULL_47_11 TaxID=1802270 RepID=A0A1G2KN61_9BACT|nr:MAG: hypothetical protein A3C07_02245 [Candidatus Sungbacteria bacterium RIFCSPHIGHO2_02_FULL_47_11]